MSIFNDGNKMTGNWFKTDVIGNKLEGTLIGRRSAINSLSGKEQTIYEILTKDGEFYNVGGKPGIDVQMRHVKLGQIVGFEYIKEVPSKTPGMNATKVVQVYANPSIVDEKWLKEYREGEAMDVQNGGGSEAENQASQPVAPAPMTLEEMVKEINNIAIEKLGAKTPEEVKEKVMESTGIAFIATNMPHILDALKQLP